MSNLAHAEDFGVETWRAETITATPIPINRTAQTRCAVTRDMIPRLPMEFLHELPPDR